MLLLRSEIEVSKKDRVSSSVVSKGNQIKWFTNGVWLKANQFGYEDIAEWVVYNLLLCSNLNSGLYVPYNLCSIKEDGCKFYKGCCSKNFLGHGDYLITVDKLLTSYGVDVDAILNRKSVEDRYGVVVNLLNKIIGFDIAGYFKILFTLDALVLNEDRHLNNIALIYNKGYRVCPIFDNGLSLLSDVNEYSYDLGVSLNISFVHAKPFSKNFAKQMNIQGYGFSVNRGRLLYFLELYRDFLGRVFDVLQYQIKKYPGIFV